jgi:hypothetical protein
VLRRIGAQVRVVVCCGCKEEGRSLSASLNKARGSPRERKGTGRPTSLPLMVGGPSGRKEGKGKGENDRGLKVGDLLP